MNTEELPDEISKTNVTKFTKKRCRGRKWN